MRRIHLLLLLGTALLAACASVPSPEARRQQASALALLLAARREDVARVITVAGNLDHAAWTDHHRVTPLHNSLNPATLRASLASVEQIHLVGEQDRVIPPTLVKAFVAGYPSTNPPEVKVLQGYGHHCCWVGNWPQLWQMITQSAPDKPKERPVKPTLRQ